MKRTLPFICLILSAGLVSLLPGCSQTTQATYYVSPDGNDDHSGRTPDEAWASIDRVNRDSFQAGDAILFEAVYDD